MTLHRPSRRARAAGWLLLLGAAAASAATPNELLAGYLAQAGSAADAARGQALFQQRGERDWSCSSCHGPLPLRPGRHAGTGKPIEPLAPAAQATRLTDAAKTEKWFRRNCKDVFNRECTPQEKADVVAWLSSLKP
ncbi:MAG: DUF1924 domain-containing protein [Rubrivivax sp.]|nr:DUF1924 domain-containing protein [Rubrivivax sp.]